jgi:hypothetical protein
MARRHRRALKVVIFWMAALVAAIQSASDVLEDALEAEE